MTRKLLLMAFATLACLLCSLGAAAAEAYACYTPSNTTLTFYYDNLRSSRTGTTYDLNEASNYPAWYQDYTRNNVTQVVFDPSFADARPTSTFSWFHGMTNLQSITGMTEYLNTSQVTNMRYMFSSCGSLTRLDVSNFNTSNVTMINHMFYGCSGLTSLDVRNFNTANVTYMNAMFYGCSGLRKLDLSAFNTAKVTNMNYMFQGCSGLTRLDLGTFNTAKVTNMTNMFQDCSNLETIRVSDGWSTARVSSSNDMFTGCTRIVGGQGTTYDANHVNKDYAHIDGGPANPGYLTEKAPEAYAVSTLEDLTLTFYYDDMRDVREGETFGMNTGANEPGWDEDATIFYFTAQVVFDPSFADARPVSTYGWFWYMLSLRSITGIEYLNTTEVTNMGYMFCNCRNLTNLDLSGFNTAKVTDMSYMFYYCDGLTSLDLSSFNTANVTNMANMFYNCTGLTSLNLSNFNTAKVTDMKEMFTYCSDLTSLNLSHFNTANVTDMSRMFGACSSLTSLDLSSFNTAKVTDMHNMFAQSENLTTIYVGDSWSTAAVTNSTSMFNGCTSLVGGKGTTYDANHVDKAYAHIDGGTSNPGYLTEKSKEAYACYTPSNTTLTFYCDKLRSTRNGTTYDLNTGNNLPVWYTDSTCYNVTTVVFNSSFASVRPTSTYCWFRGMGNLRSITGMTEYLNTSEVTMMWSMFSGCSNLTSLDVTNFNTANVTNLGALFFGCSSLANIDVSNFNTSQVTTLSDMFYGCSGLTSLDLSSFNTAHVGVMMNMFRDCSKLTTIYVGNEWSTDIVNYSNYMFTGCTRLVGGQGTTYNANHVDKAYAHIDGGPSNPGYFTDINAAVTPEAYACYTPSNTTLTFYYDSQRSTRTGTTYDLNTGSNIPVWYTDSTCYNVTKVVFNSSFASARPTSTYRWFSRMSKLTSITGLNYLNTSEVTNMSTMFYGCTKLTSLTLTGFNTANVRRMDYMFQNCTGLTSLDVSDFNTANVTAMNAMFSGCSALTSLDVSNFNTANVTTMSQMFYDCKKLTSLDVSSFNTANVTGMYIMFSGCSGLTSLDLSGFNTANVATLGSMFSGCSALTSLDVSDFNTANVTNMSQMFLGCKKLTNLDLSNFNTTNVTTMNRMFQGCSELTTVYVGDGWSTESVTTSTSMFLNCTSLVGGQGTTYDANHVDAAYAHIDGGTSNPGYFTAEGAQPWTEPEAYAVILFGEEEEEGCVLTFYYDNQRSTRIGTSYDLNEGFNDPGWYLDGRYESVTQVVFEASFADVRPTSTCGWFWGMTKLQSITGMDCLNTEGVTTMWGMFTNCRSLTVIDASSFNTANVTNALSMFDGCTNLTTIFGGDGWNTNSMSVSTDMFKNCVNLVGGKGTTYDANHTNKAYARIDGGPSNPGYFTAKFLLGDVNGDGVVNITDATVLINALLNENFTGINLNAADVSGDGLVNITDATLLINRLLNSRKVKRSPASAVRQHEQMLSPTSRR